ncbi:MAG TPA: kelch repeat-containing protein [Rhodanobacteraceae bacterium]|nr:kelch repeat-containing protein [Rhodanobacteraceae bacterium]
MNVLACARAVGAARVWIFGVLVATAFSGIATERAQAAQFVAAAPLPAPRERLGGVLLPSGKVFAIGGAFSTDVATTEIYDPAADTWAFAAPLQIARGDFTATLLKDGRVLAAAGFNGGAIRSAEVYNPATNAWTRTGDLADARSLQTATLLPSGKVLVAGGYNLGAVRSAELFDPVTNAWTSAGQLNVARYWHAAALLPSGKVLVTGGSGAGSVPLASAELYDPATNTWALTGPMGNARSVIPATALPTGKVLVEGGDGTSGVLASAELYDPASGTWAFAASANHTRAFHSATLLPSGHVLVAGGFDGAAVLEAEIYDPSVDAWHVAGTMVSGREFHAAVALPSGKVVFAGGNNGGTLDNVEIFDPSTTTSITSIAPDQTAIGESYAVAFEVDAASGTPTGSVIVSDDAGASCGPVTLVSGAGSCALVSMAAGGRTITATYAPDDDAFAASSGLSSHWVNRAAPVVTIVSDAPDPSEIFASYAVAVHVDPAIAGLPTPTGSVEIDAGMDSCSAMLDANADASCVLAGQVVGTFDLVASYFGDAVYDSGESAPEPHTVGPAATTIFVSSGSFSSVTTEPVTFFATLDSNLGSVPGTVTIGDGESSCTAEIDFNFATCAVAFAHVGEHEITATYDGDAEHAPAVSDPIEHFVGPASTQVSIRSHLPEPSVPGQAVAVTVDVTVEPPGVGFATGSIEVDTDFSGSCIVAASGESCDIEFALRGQQSLNAVYLGNDDFIASTTSAIHRVNEPPFANGDLCTTYEDQTLIRPAAGGVLSNDTDEDGDPLFVADPGPRTAGGIGGTVTLAVDGSYTYTPPPDANGNATFQYTVSDGLETATGEATIEVFPVNDPPTFALAASPHFDPGSSGEHTTPSFAQMTSSGPPDETNSPLAWHVRTISDPSGVLSAPATIALDGTLTTTLSGHGGVATVGVALQDDGGTDNGGNDTSGEQTFTVAVGAGADLSIAIFDGTGFVEGGGPVVYEVTVRNLGPDGSTGARALVVPSPNLVDVSWTCSAFDGGTCAASGSGQIEDFVDLPAGASVVYELSATVLADPELPAEVLATITALGGGGTDFNPDNDSASDTDTTGIFADGYDSPPDEAEDAPTAARRR